MFGKTHLYKWVNHLLYSGLNFKYRLTLSSSHLPDFILNITLLLMCYMAFLDYSQWENISEYLVSLTTRNGSSLSLMLIVYILTYILYEDPCFGGSAQFPIWGNRFSFLFGFPSEWRKKRNYVRWNNSIFGNPEMKEHLV